MYIFGNSKILKNIIIKNNNMLYVNQKNNVNFFL